MSGLEFYPHMVGNNAIFKDLVTQLTAFSLLLWLFYLLFGFYIEKQKSDMKFRFRINLQFSEAVGIKVRNKIIIIMLMSGQLLV